MVKLVLEHALVQVSADADVESARQAARDVDAVVATFAGNDGILRCGQVGGCANGHIPENSFPSRELERRQGCFDFARGSLRSPPAALSMTGHGGLIRLPPQSPLGSGP